MLNEDKGQVNNVVYAKIKDTVEQKIYDHIRATLSLPPCHLTRACMSRDDGKAAIKGCTFLKKCRKHKDIIVVDLSEAESESILQKVSRKISNFIR